MWRATTYSRMDERFFRQPLLISMCQSGRLVGRFEIIREVGRGGMAVVYLARQVDLDREVALKELPTFHASDPTSAARFLRESRILGRMAHPNVVTVHDYFVHEEIPY